MALNAKNDSCLYGGCEKWAARFKAGGIYEECARCGFDMGENARRLAVPLTLCADGLRRKIIPRRPCADAVPKIDEGKND